MATKGIDKRSVKGGVVDQQGNIPVSSPKIAFTGSDIIEAEARALRHRSNRLHSYWKKLALGSAATAVVGLVALFIKSVVYGLPSEIKSIHIPDEVLSKFSDAVRLNSTSTIGGSFAEIDSVASSLIGMLAGMLPIVGGLLAVASLYGIYRAQMDEQEALPSRYMGLLFAVVIGTSGFVFGPAFKGEEDEFRDSERSKFTADVKGYANDRLYETDDGDVSKSEIDYISHVIERLTKESVAPDAISYLVAQMIYQRKQERSISADTNAVLNKNIVMLTETSDRSFKPDLKILYVLESSTGARLSPEARAYADSDEDKRVFYKALNRVALGITWLLLGIGGVCYMVARSMRKRVAAVEKYLPFSVTDKPLQDDSPIRTQAYDDKPWEGK